MNPAIAPMVSGYRTGVDAFRGKLGADHPKVKAAEACVAELEAIGERCGDVVQFMEQADAAMERMNVALAELSAAQPLAVSSATAGGAAAPAAPPTGVPPAAQVALGFHMAWDAMDRNAPTTRDVGPVYERIFQIEREAGTAPVFNRMLAEEGIYTRLASEQQKGIAREAIAHIRGNGLSQPCMLHHYDRLGQAMAAVHSPTEVEYEVNRLVALNGCENEWDTLWVHFATKAIGEVAGFYMDQSDGQQKNVVAAYRFVAAYFGRNWEQMFGVPRVWEFWVMLFEKSKSTWVSERNCRTPAEAAQFHTNTFYGIMNNQGVPVASVPLGPPQRQESFTLWGRPVHMDRLLEAYGAPGRPEVDLSG